MAVVNRLDPATVGECLSAWLPRALPGVTGVAVSGVQVSRSTGMSSESVLLDAEWTVDGRRVHRGLVARVAPADGGLFDGYDLAREARVMSALAEATTVPVDLGALPPDAAMPLANPASVALAAMLDLPSPSGETGWITGSR